MFLALWGTRENKGNFVGTRQHRPPPPPLPLGGPHQVYITEEDKYTNDWFSLIGSLSVTGSTQLCYSCTISTSMEECISKMTQYNCSRIGAFQSMCARSCDRRKGLYIRECAIEYKCTVKQKECKDREDMADGEQKAQGCEYHCCEGNLCNSHPCTSGHTRPQPKSNLGLALFFPLLILFTPN